MALASSLATCGRRPSWAGRAALVAGVVATLLAAGCAGPAPPAPPSAPSAPSVPPSSWGPLPVPPPGPDAGPTGDPMLFGLDVGSLALQSGAGLQPDYATIWIGKWNLDQGWLVPDAQLTALREAAITPAIHLYYWGDDIGPGCFEAGCNGKTVAGWDRLASELAQHLEARMGGEPVLVVLETEFNKGSVARHEPLDALLAAKATDLKAAYPAARVVLGFGGWNPDAWDTWDRAAAASDAVGLQALAGAEPEEGPDGSLFEETLAGARQLRDQFGKPVVLQDVAVPSAPGPATAETQAQALAPFLAGLPELKDAGVEAILYRSFDDSPGAALTHYYGEAERHFGLAEAGTGALKPAGVAWLEAVRAERGGGLAATAS